MDYHKAIATSSSSSHFIWFLVILSHHLIHLALVVQLSKPGSLDHWPGISWASIELAHVAMFGQFLGFQNSQTAVWWAKHVESPCRICGNVPVSAASLKDKSMKKVRIIPPRLLRLDLHWLETSTMDRARSTIGFLHLGFSKSVKKSATIQFAGVNCELVLESLGQCWSCTCGTSATVPFAAKCGKECGCTDPMTLRKEYQKSNATIIYNNIYIYMFYYNHIECIQLYNMQKSKWICKIYYYIV